MMKAELTVACTVTLLATAYLSISLMVLQPPRANFPAWFSLAAVCVAQGVLTLVAITMPRPPGRLRAVVAAGACVLIAIAVWRVRDTLNSSHFEGYNLLLGAMLVVQGALTLAAFVRSAPGHLLTPHA
jgi:hypothetical protein